MQYNNSNYNFKVLTIALHRSKTSGVVCNSPSCTGAKLNYIRAFTDDDGSVEAHHEFEITNLNTDEAGLSSYTGDKLIYCFVVVLEPEQKTDKQVIKSVLKEATCNIVWRSIAKQHAEYLLTIFAKPITVNLTAVNPVDLSQDAYDKGKIELDGEVVKLD